MQELTVLRAAAEAKRREKLNAAKEAVLADTRAKLGEFGLTPESVMPRAFNTAAPARKTRKDAETSPPAKNRGPNGEEWSGRGRLPK